MTPEECLDQAQYSINQEQWDRATAFALAGLLEFAIGAAKGLAALGFEVVDL